MSVAQTCGRACVWCAATLATESAVELGSRTTHRFDTDFTWFRRSCRSCAVGRAYLALLDHTQKCGRCSGNPARCQEAHILRQWLKKAKR
ncbi:hypothetical protein ABZ916_37095 [Streptomyces sp. NPDC046853]|uniref:hypothetical protein n=1 Tax=Streptomyces sp. NPDC046853 TaxID=3154920 RepID=UPI0033D75F5D